jgi:hypothetical protein
VGVDVAVGVAVSVGGGVSVGCEVAVAVGLGLLVGTGVAGGTGRSVGTNDGKTVTAACKGVDSTGSLIPPPLSLQAFRTSRLNNRKIHGLNPTILLKRIVVLFNKIFQNRHQRPGYFRETLPNIQENPPDENPAGLDQVITPDRDLL